MGDNGQVSGETAASKMRKTVRRFNELEEKTHINCSIRYSGFHPPPASRRLMGDLAYLEVTTPGYPDEPVLCITAIPTGFYVNRSSSVSGQMKFDPSPANEPCFAHALLDCLLQASESFRTAWADALVASKERAELTASTNNGGVSALQRVAVRGDFGGFQSPSAVAASQGIDALVSRPSWLVSLPRLVDENGSDWAHNGLHEYDPARTEDDISNYFGLDIRGGALRDWNEELQSAREMPTSILHERLERARLIHKVMHDFGEASVLGVMAIVDGHVQPMNPNEPMRNHVYLHNNIFFSRAIDLGADSFRVAKGDRAARKSASREAQSVGMIHRLDVEGLHTLATVLVDYLGTRFVCQSIVPGILHGDRTHTLLCGAVEATSPLAWDEEMHKLMEETLGRVMMIASRPVPTNPLTDERVAEIERLRTTAFGIESRTTKENVNDSPVTQVCGPLEVKGILGSDKRKYLLDLARLSPRDANWVSESQGGTGRWEAVGRTGLGKSIVPEQVDDDEWTMAVLRPELVSRLTQSKMTKYLESKKEEGASSNDKNSEDTSTETAADIKGDETEKSTSDSATEKPSERATKNKLTAEDKEYMKSMRLNVNVFLPDIRSIDGLVDEEAMLILEKDMEKAREVALYLWDEVLPRLTEEIKEASGNLPSDGAHLTELLHQRGINCRYLGRLATLAAAEEQFDRTALDDVQNNRSSMLTRKVMPYCWLEMLECEMVARAAKHVLNSYLSEKGGIAASQPMQTIASFLSALVSTAEETAADTEMRLQKQNKSSTASLPDEEDINALSMVGTGGSRDGLGASIRVRNDVWGDIEREIGRRFRYKLALFNNGSDRATYIPLLRRVCQRTGVRLVAKNYAVGEKCLCSGGSISEGGLTYSYPISPLDIVDVVPLVKHAASHGGQGFVPSSKGPGVILPSLHVLLPDAKALLDAAHIHYSQRALPQALDFAQEASALYQRVVESPIHASIFQCLDFLCAVLFEANQHELAAANASRALALAVQLGGFDSHEAVSAHTTLSHILIALGNVGDGTKHLRAALYLMEVLAGPRHAELPSTFHKLGQTYHRNGEIFGALQCYQEAGARQCCDRILEGAILRNSAVILVMLQQLKTAVDMEKRAYRIFTLVLGEEHDTTKLSRQTLERLTKLAVEQSTKQAVADKQRKEEEAANAMASAIAEAEEETKKKKKKNKKKK